MAFAKPSLERLETKAVEEDSRSKSTRQQWRHLFEDFCTWLRDQGQELNPTELDTQLSEYLRSKYFERKPRSFAVNVVKAVKFEVPSELGRDGLWRARSAVARWEALSGPWVESDASKALQACLQAFGTLALCQFLGSSLGVFTLLSLRRLFKGMAPAVDYAVQRVFQHIFPKAAGSGGKFLQEDFANFFTAQLSKELSDDGELKEEEDDIKDVREKPGEEAEPRPQTPKTRHAAIRLVIKNSPALLQLEVSGSAAWQVNGHFALLGEELCDLNMDTVGLFFRKGGPSPRNADELNLLDGNNLETCTGAGCTGEVAALGERLRCFLDPKHAPDVMEVLNSKTLSTISKLFPDGKYDVALLQETWTAYEETGVYALEETNWLKKIRGRPNELYLSVPDNGDFDPENVNLLLKTQKHLDSNRVDFYSQQFQQALADGSPRRPTALIFDFFNHGEIHAVLPDEPDSVRGPGGRRKQKRAAEACDAKYMQRRMKAWILLDGHHKVEAAARLGCSVNCLVFAPCAEPYEPIEAEEESSPLLAKSVCFPDLWPDAHGVPQAVWEAAKLCPHSPMLLSSGHMPPEKWQDALGCTCFQEAPEWFPSWGIPLQLDTCPD
ncbi:unnamed protein product [Durusdinium trenchii]|uniref:Uncharacterized protein n=1 Tax=Durusdinium trenchii TaxID=1381693 RepID=A0ABP0HDB1_9DINO